MANPATKNLEDSVFKSPERAIHPKMWAPHIIQKPRRAPKSPERAKHLKMWAQPIIIKPRRGSLKAMKGRNILLGGKAPKQNLCPIHQSP